VALEAASATRGRTSSAFEAWLTTSTKQRSGTIQAQYLAGAASVIRPGATMTKIQAFVYFDAPGTASGRRSGSEPA
jgi:hypothetical protein